MKRKVTANSTGSLELLLDTICNTFGGILLISLLVAVLLNATSKAVVNATATPESQAELIAAEIERERVEGELEELRESVQKQAVVASDLMPQDLIEEAKKYQKAAQQHTELVSRKTTKVGNASQAQLRINDLTRESAERKARLEKARREKVKLDKEVKATVAKRSRDAAIPKLSESLTEPEAYFVVQKRLFGPWHTGKFDRFNDADFTQTMHQGRQVLRPKPGGGIAIPSSSDDNTALTEKLADLDTSTEHAMIFVWSDSYAEFEVVRQALVQNSIKLELVPWLDGKEVTVGQKSDFTPSQVQ
jgi:hypothetical protein